MVYEGIQPDLGHLHPSLHNMPVTVSIKYAQEACWFDNEDKMPEITITSPAQVDVHFAQNVGRCVQ